MEGRSLIRGKCVVTGIAADGAASVLDAAAVCQEDGIIVEVGPFRALARKHPDARVLGSDRSVVIPGLVNAHHHVGLTPLQLGSPDYPLELWIASRLGARAVDPYLDTLYSAFEMIESGVTTVQHIQGRLLDPAGEGQGTIASVLHAYSDVGMRVSFCVNLRDQNRLVYESDDAFLGRLPAELAAQLEPLLRAQEVSLADQLKWFFAEPLRITGANRGERVRVQLAPANLHWCSDEALTAIANHASDAGVPMHMHLLETAYQREYGRRRSGGGVVRHLAEFGMLGPSMTLGHGVWLNDDDIDLLVQTGTMVCHNPSSNLRLKSGIAPVNQLLSRGVPLALGIDEAGINDDRDMFLEMRLALNLHRAPGIESMAPTATEVFGMATENGARTTGFAGLVGRLEPGYKADLVLIDWDQIAKPYLDEGVPTVDAIVRRAKISGVQTVVVAGEIIFADGRFTKVDKAAAMARLEADLASPLPEEVQRRRAMSRALLAHIRACTRTGSATQNGWEQTVGDGNSS